MTTQSDSENFLFNYKLLYINLDKSTERRNLMEVGLKKHNIEFERIVAIPCDVQNFSKRITYKFQDIDGIKYPVYIKKNRGQTNAKLFYCFLSHFKTLYKFKKMKEDIILVAEDDISFDYVDKWKENLDTIIKNAPNDWTLIKLHNSNFKCIKSMKKLAKTKKIKYINITKNESMYYFSAGLYVINKKYIKVFEKKYLTDDKLNIDFGNNSVSSGKILCMLPGCYHYTLPLVLGLNFISTIEIGNKKNVNEIKSNLLVKKFYEWKK